MTLKKYDLEDRLVSFTCDMIDLVDSLPDSRAGNYIAGQLIKSCHAPTFNYGEAQGAGSPKDFVHKLGIVLKELKECRTALKIIRHKVLIESNDFTEKAFRETEELIAIFAKSIDTARKNNGLG